VDTSTLIFIIIIVAVPWLAVIIYGSLSSKGILKSYKSLSDKYGFETDVTKKSGLRKLPVVKGKYRNIPVEIGSFINQSGRKKPSATYVKAACTNPAGLEFIIVKKNHANEIKFGAKSFSISDAEFDGKFIVNTNNGEKMFSLLNFSIKYKLLQSLNVGFNGELKLEGNNLSYIENELIKNNINLLRIEILLHLLCEISDELKSN
jgi:hypothetical protein